MRTLWTRLKATLRKGRCDRSLDAELEFHLDMQIEENLRRGMAPAEARAAARRSFGGLAQVREAYRERRGLPWLDRIVQDARYGLRMLRRAPGFTAAAVLTLALGIGAATAGFSVVYAVVFRPLQFAGSERAVTVFAAPAWSEKPFPPGEAMFVKWRDHARCFDLFAGVRHTVMVLSGLGEPRKTAVAEVSADFFRLTGVQPAMGRVFSREEGSGRPRQGSAAQ